MWRAPNLCMGSKQEQLATDKKEVGLKMHRRRFYCAAAAVRYINKCPSTFYFLRKFCWTYNPVKMLCEISDYIGGSLFGIWMSMNVITFTFIFGTSAPVFYFYYWPSKVTYQKWIYKVHRTFDMQKLFAIILWLLFHKLFSQQFYLTLVE